MISSFAYTKQTICPNIILCCDGVGLIYHLFNNFKDPERRRKASHLKPLSQHSIEFQFT